jgi:hypothetical protein
MVSGKLRAVINRETYADLEHWEKDSLLGKSNKAWQGESLVRFEVKPNTNEVELILGGQRLKRQSER